MKYILTIALSCFLYANTNAQSKTVQKLWQTDSVFKVPESVLFHAKKNLLYVSNIDGKEPWGKDGVGSIGKLNTDGSIINIEWVKGLNAPKGMGIHKGKLYVADLTEVVVIDIKSGTIQSKIAVAGAERLNDISINKKGVVYVSDSKARRVYTIENGNATVLVDSFSLKGPNGVLAHKNNFYVLDNGGLYKLEQNKTLTKIADGMDASTDGVAVINKTDFIVSCWSGIVYYVSANGTKQVLIDGRNEKVNSADIGFDAATNTIFVPTFWRNSIAAYRVN
jgi:sugar lactone lactonase YvrE